MNKKDIIVINDLKNCQKYELWQYDTGIKLDVSALKNITQVDFVSGSERKKALIIDGLVEIPNDILARPSDLILYLVEVNSEFTMTEHKIVVRVKRRSAPSEEIAPENQQTFIEQVQSIVNSAKATVDDVQRRADSGEFNGKDGYTPQKGIDYFDGEKGEKGDDGYTPQKGVDYFTDSEIEQIEKEVADKVDLSKCVPTSRKIGNKDLSEDWTYDDLGTQVTLSGVMAQYVVDTVKALTKSVDVQIDGTSIVEDGIANIPKAGNNSLGTVSVRANGWYGITFNDVNTGLSLYRTNIGSQFPTRTFVRNAPLLLDQVDDVLKRAMCDGVGAEWTEEEQKSAQLRLGILASEGVGF